MYIYIIEYKYKCLTFASFCTFGSCLTGRTWIVAEGSTSQVLIEVEDDVAAELGIKSGIKYYVIF